EDGIRDLTVTGVQTCALPICGDVPGRACCAQRYAPCALQSHPYPIARGAGHRLVAWPNRSRASRCATRALDSFGDNRYGFYLRRSEERRVGKECRSRWVREW